MYDVLTNRFGRIEGVCDCYDVMMDQVITIFRAHGFQDFEIKYILGTTLELSKYVTREMIEIAIDKL